ncbi:MAG: hypothetical protein ACRCTT_22640 [Enterobacter roggenkampii]
MTADPRMSVNTGATVNVMQRIRAFWLTLPHVTSQMLSNRSDRTLKRRLNRAFYYSMKSAHCAP